MMIADEAYQDRPALPRSTMLSGSSDMWDMS